LKLWNFFLNKNVFLTKHIHNKRPFKNFNRNNKNAEFKKILTPEHIYTLTLIFKRPKMWFLTTLKAPPTSPTKFFFNKVFISKTTLGPKF
jgi:hypothetical protein